MARTGKRSGSDMQSLWRKASSLTASLCGLLLCVLGTLSLGCAGEEAAGPPPVCDVTCICTGFPGRPAGSGTCDECNPFGEIFAEVECPGNVAIGGSCNFRMTSSNPAVLAIQLTDHNVLQPKGIILSPTIATLPGNVSSTQVIVTFTRLNDNVVIAQLVYTVSNNCVL